MWWIALLHSREKVRAPVSQSCDLTFFSFIVLWLTDHVFIYLSYPFLILNKLLVSQSFQVKPTFLLHIHGHSRSLFLSLPSLTTLPHQQLLYIFYLACFKWKWLILCIEVSSNRHISNRECFPHFGWFQTTQWETADCFSLPTPVCMKGPANIEKNTNATFF